MISLNVEEESAADDTFQSLFLSIVKTPVPRDSTQVVAYVYRVLTNDMIDERRKADVHDRFVRRCRRYGDYRTRQEDPEAEAIEVEETRRMLQALRKHLPDHQAEAVIQSCVLGNNTEDAAEEMDLDRRTFSQYLYRGKERMRRLIGEKRKEQGDNNEHVQKKVKL